ncbi:TetR/AcrR family transcriptional regulator [Jongsikchunia kroppenstedtii]|uniref:TetR/AcrR family transcriptional regulator n=1 Tax=Jongsikchunia kroppenstedtii TaxID=1121721 RepID=UPI0003730883|nr:TetR/AcrR family transcriptional regulator [Jongsikchunia kroppenstedtii]
MIVEGLREAKKAATRRALASAVVHLAARDGLDRVTAEDIAAEANVSVRTYHNYFASKEDALQFYMAEVMAELLERLQGSDPALPLNKAIWDALIDVCCDSAGAPTPATMLLRLFDTEPRVHSVSSAQQMEECRQQFEEYFERRCPDVDPLYCWLVLTSGVGAVRLAVELWTEGATGGRTLRETIEVSVRQLDAGFDAPVLRMA